MPSDIRLNEESVIVKGNLGQGTESPKRAIHTESGEIHSGGPSGGFSFSDRSKAGLVDNPGKGERWVWYAANGRASLWSGQDILSITRDALGSSATLAANLVVKNVQADLVSKARLIDVVAESLRGVSASGPDVVNCTAEAVALNRPGAPVTVLVFPEDTFELVAGKGEGVAAAANDKPPTSPGPSAPIPQQIFEPRLALYHDYLANQRDVLVLNHLDRYKDGVRVQGDLLVTGDLTHASSIALKDEVEPLHPGAALDALSELDPVTFRWRSGGDRRAGFIAEDVPDLLAQPGHDRVNPVEILAVLTGALKEQQRMIDALTDRVTALETRR